MPTNLLIVESPSKAKTLKKYLGRGFEVLASFGHVRDLIAKEGAVDPDNGFHMKYQLISRNSKHLDAIAKAVGNAETILLATDPDREGEAIAWHISEILKARKLLKNKKAKRVVFYEITESAVKEAVANPRDISMPLVNAQQARRALDHLVGFNLSPLLWRKIGSGLSAGRVQSPALRLIVEREQEIEAFKPQEYWSIHLDSHKNAQKFTARLAQYRKEKLEQLSIANEEQQKKIIAQLKKSGDNAIVTNVEKKPKLRNPAAPFITSTLQQEAVRKLGLSTERTMRIAQQLYEGIDVGNGTVGLITYMRTDSVNLAKDAIQEIRDYISKNFNADYLPKSPVYYKSKTKNAQEAHEAIRPTSIFRTPESMRPFLTDEQARLYEMIWKRSLACQMNPARFDTTSVDISLGEGLFRASGQVLVFPGFIAVYQEGADDAADDDEDKLPSLNVSETIPVDDLRGEQHFTQPPPRYTEASLVKTLEEHGIGRPSTYASIVSTLQDRGYAFLDKKRFIPTDIGRLVNGFLTSHFNDYVDYDFTAKLEDRLDQISNGQREWVPVLEEFWIRFSKELQSKENVGRGCPMPEECPKCKKQLFLQNSKRGLFVGCSGYPDCDYTRPWGTTSSGPVTLGTDPKSGLDVLLLRGPYGFYVQLGQTEEGTKPRRAAWPANIPLSAATLEQALQVLSLPRVVGNHPETGEQIEANIGRFGPYLKYNGAFKSIPKSDSVYTIGLERAVALLAEPKANRGVLVDLGAHPDDKKPVTVNKGRFGPYVKHGKVYASIPDKLKPESLTLKQALELLQAKLEKTQKPEKKKAAAKKPVEATEKPKATKAKKTTKAKTKKA